jgi:hypothetical protein
VEVFVECWWVEIVDQSSQILAMSKYARAIVAESDQEDEVLKCRTAERNDHGGTVREARHLGSSKYVNLDPRITHNLLVSKSDIVLNHGFPVKSRSHKIGLTFIENNKADGMFTS